MQKRPLWLALAAGCGGVFSAAFHGTFLRSQIWILPWWLHGIVFLGLMVIGSWIWIQSLKWVQHWQRGITRRGFIAGLVLCLFAGIFLAVVLPLHGPFTPQRHSVQIIASGERNENALGSEIWLLGIDTRAQPHPVDLLQVCSGDWDFRKGAWISSSVQEIRLVCKVNAVDHITLRFREGMSSGVVAVVADQLPKFKSDLYAETNGVRDIMTPLGIGRKQNLISLGVILGAGLWIGWILFASNLFLLQRPVIKTQGSKNFRWYAFAIPLFIFWFLYLIAFWPGFMNPDARSQWDGMIAGKIHNWHPAFHTLTFWLITRIWFSPAAVALAQVLALSILSGCILAYVRRNGAPAWIVVAAAIMLILPPYGLAVISLWKDVPYGITILAFTFCILLIIESEAAWIRRSLAWLGTGASGALAALYRHNGPPGVFVALGLLFLGYPKYRKQFAAALLTAVFLFACIRGPIYRFAGVPKGSTNPGLQLAMAHLIARHTQAQTPLLREERFILASIRDDVGKWPYNCYFNNPLVFDGKMDQGKLQRSTSSLARIAIRLTLSNPAETLKHLACNSSFILVILPPMTDGQYSQYEASPLNLSPNPRPDRQHPQVSSRWPALRDAIFALTEGMYFSKLNWFFWRSPFWLYLLVYSTGIAALRTKRREYWLLLVPVLLNTLPLAFISFIQAFRLVMPLMIVSLLFSGFLITRNPD